MTPGGQSREHRPSADRLPGPLVLVGLSGAGKTVVGRLLASRLGWGFVDLDEEVERLAGRTIAELFAAEGEPHFRDLERLATFRADVGSGAVVSTGGGWMNRSDLRDVWPGALRIWLRVEPVAAVARLARDGVIRPLLAGPDPEVALRAQLVERLPAYGLAEVEVRTDDLEPAAVVDAIWNELAARGLLPAAR